MRTNCAPVRTSTKNATTPHCCSCAPRCFTRAIAAAASASSSSSSRNISGNSNSTTGGSASTSTSTSTSTGSRSQTINYICKLDACTDNRKVGQLPAVSAPCISFRSRVAHAGRTCANGRTTKDSSTEFARHRRASAALLCWRPILAQLRDGFQGAVSGLVLTRAFFCSFFCSTCSAGARGCCSGCF